MDKRIQFGVDYLNFMWELITVTNNNDLVAWACTKMFLLDWGFNSEEIQQIIALNDKQAISMKSMSNAKRIEYGNDSTSRIIDFIGSNQISKERLLVQVSVIAGINLSLSREAYTMINALGVLFEVDDRALSIMIKKGQDLSFLLNIFGITYSSAERAKVILPKIRG